MKGNIRTRIACTITVVSLVLLCVACAPTNAGESNHDDRSDAGESTMSVAWSPSIDCAVCHETQVGAFSDSTMTAALHSDSTCFDCHFDGDALAKTHENATEPPTRSSSNSYTMASRETCLGECHTSYDELADLTAGSTALIDLDGVIINPHAVPKSSGHLPDSKECYNCHTIHTEEPPNEQYCRDCHHTNYYSSCSKCHDDK